MSRSALVVTAAALIAAIALSGCGRKGDLEPPAPRAATTR